MTATPYAPETALTPGLQLLIDRCILWRAASNDTLVEPEAFAAELDEVVGRGEMTLRQAETLSKMLGVRAA